MENKETDQGPVAIRIKGGKNIQIIGNTSIGMPLLDVENADNLSASGNRTVKHQVPNTGHQVPNTGHQAPVQRKAWYEHVWVKVIGCFIVLPVFVSWLVYMFGWN